jgi:hypothetical protein
MRRMTSSSYYYRQQEEPADDDDNDGNNTQMPLKRSYSQWRKGGRKRGSYQDWRKGKRGEEFYLVSDNSGVQLDRRSAAGDVSSGFKQWRKTG